MNLLQFIKKKVVRDAGLVSGGSPQESERNLLIADPQSVKDWKLQEYDVWYSGDSDELLNFYTRGMGIDLQYEPWYFKNRRSFFWAQSSTESDIKRSTSGIARSIVDTLVGIVGRPMIHVGATPAYKSIYAREEDKEDKDGTERLNDVLSDCSFWSTTYNTQMTKTLYQGWGAYKISWDKRFSNKPSVSYYSAQNVDWVMRNGKVVSMIFRDWYRGEKDNENYLVIETRTLKYGNDRSVLIETKAYRQMPIGDSDSQMTEIDLNEVPELAGVDNSVEILHFDNLLAYPCVLLDSNCEDGIGMPGRSVFEGRIDLFDDLDQELSQKANTVMKSTPVEYFNTDFLERDLDTGLPIMPKRYDRKYTSFHGGRNAEGSPMSAEPVQVTQPNIHFAEYSQSAVETLKFILHGILSPATMGIDVSAQATQQSQREKEKITISFRNKLIDREMFILKSLCSGILCADEYLRTGRITTKKYDISIRYDEFADTSFEQKLMALGESLDNGNISPEMYLDKLYGDSLSEDDYQKELKFLKKAHDPEVQLQMQQAAQEQQMQMMAEQQAMQGGIPPEMQQAIDEANGDEAA